MTFGDILNDLVKSTKMFRIRFHGTEYLLIGDLEDGGAISTQEQFDHMLESHAHLFPDGAIRRYGVEIGSHNDIEIIEEINGQT